MYKIINNSPTIAKLPATLQIYREARNYTLITYIQAKTHIGTSTNNIYEKLQ